MTIKPHGLTVIPDQAQDFLKQMDIAKFSWRGQNKVERLHEMGIYTGADLLMSQKSLFNRRSADSLVMGFIERQA